MAVRKPLLCECVPGRRYHIWQPNADQQRQAEQRAEKQIDSHHDDRKPLHRISELQKRFVI
jgi:hypothetical protein